MLSIRSFVYSVSDLSPRMHLFSYIVIKGITFQSQFLSKMINKMINWIKDSFLFMTGIGYI